MIEGVHSREWYLGKGRKFGECKEVSEWVQSKDKCRSKEIGRDRKKMESKVESRSKWVQKK